MSTKALSVIVPSFNMEAFLSKCLSSLVVSSRLMDLLDVLVVNDGSTDSTSEIAHEFADKWPETFRVIDKANGHYGSCVNAALPVLRGTYVRILDADDSVDNNNFSDFLTQVIIWGKKDQSPDMIVADHCTVDTNDDVISMVHYGLPSDRFISPDEILDFTRTNIGVQAVTHRTENLRRMGYRQLEGTPYTDTQWSLDPISGVRSVAYYPRPVTRYLYGREGQTMDPIQFTKNATKQAEVSLAIYRRFAEIRKNAMPDFGRYYLAGVRANMHWVYSLFVFGCDGIYPQDNGGWFDKELRGILPDLWQEVEERWMTAALHFHWLREWRRNGCSRQSLKFLIYFFQHWCTNNFKKIVKLNS